MNFGDIAWGRTLIVFATDGLTARVFPIKTAVGHLVGAQKPGPFFVSTLSGVSNTPTLFFFNALEMGLRTFFVRKSKYLPLSSSIGST